MKYRKQACLGIALAVLAACDMKDPVTGNSNSSKQVSIIAVERRLSEIAAQANQAAPANIDPETRLDGVKAGPGLKLTSMYTLVNPESEGVDSTNIGAKLTPVVTSGSCKNPDLRPLIDQGVVVVLEYRGLDGKPIGTVSVNHDACKAVK